MKQRTILLMTLCSILCCTIAIGAEHPRIMIVNSYHAEYPWVIAHNQALRDNLTDKAKLTFYYLDSKRVSQDESRQKAKEILGTIQQDKPNLVILTDDFALNELGPATMNAEVPVVFLGINNNPRQYLGTMTLATGVLERPLLKRSIVYIQEILGPKMDKCLVLFDNGVTAKVTLDNIFLGRESSRFSHTTTDIRLIDSYAEWKRTVLNAKQDGYDAIILGLYHTLVDESGTHIPDEVVANWTSKHSPVPIFGFWGFSIGKDKALGGLVLSGYPQGKEAARLAEKVLRGRDPHTIQPVTAEHGRFIFSRSGLKRWGLKLPAYFHTSHESVTYVE